MRLETKMFPERRFIMEKMTTKEQEKLIRRIMEKNSPQRQVDKIVEKTKLAMEIFNKEGQQAEVDKITEEQLFQECNSKTPADE